MDNGLLELSVNSNEFINHARNSTIYKSIYEMQTINNNIPSDELKENPTRVLIKNNKWSISNILNKLNEIHGNLTNMPNLQSSETIQSILKLPDSMFQFYEDNAEIITKSLYKPAELKNIRNRVLDAIETLNVNNSNKKLEDVLIQYGYTVVSTALVLYSNSIKDSTLDYLINKQASLILKTAYNNAVRSAVRKVTYETLTKQKLIPLPLQYVANLGGFDMSHEVLTDLIINKWDYDRPVALEDFLMNIKKHRNLLDIFLNELSIKMPELNGIDENDINSILMAFTQLNRYVPTLDTLSKPLIMDYIRTPHEEQTLVNIKEVSKLQIRNLPYMSSHIEVDVKDETKVQYNLNNLVNMHYYKMDKALEKIDPKLYGGAELPMPSNIIEKNEILITKNYTGDRALIPTGVQFNYLPKILISVTYMSADSSNYLSCSYKYHKVMRLVRREEVLGKEYSEIVKSVMKPNDFNNPAPFVYFHVFANDEDLMVDVCNKMALFPTNSPILKSKVEYKRENRKAIPVTYKKVQMNKEEMDAEDKAIAKGLSTMLLNPNDYDRWRFHIKETKKITTMSLSDLIDETLKDLKTIYDEQNTDQEMNEQKLQDAIYSTKQTHNLYNMLTLGSLVNHRNRLPSYLRIVQDPELRSEFKCILGKMDLDQFFSGNAFVSRNFYNRTRMDILNRINQAQSNTNVLALLQIMSVIMNSFNIHEKYETDTDIHNTMDEMFSKIDALIGVTPDIYGVLLPTPLENKLEYNVEI
jgi:hypothetical protein